MARGVARSTRNRRQKWIVQSQSVSLFLATPDLKTLSHIYRRAWDKVSRCGAIKTTCYLRTLQASGVEKTTFEMKKEQRSHMATQAAAAAATKKEYTEAQKNACSIDAMLNGGECEACQ